jgi:hypothetical protein
MNTQRIVLGITLVCCLSACQEKKVQAPIIEPDPVELHLDWSPLISKTVTVQGIAQNRTLGATVSAEHGVIWIDDFSGWPKEIYPSIKSQTRVRVTGTLLKRDDMPVYLVEPDDPSIRAGIAVDSKEELERLKWRYLLKDVSWSVVEDE